jgi:hypothetical protein
MDDLPIDCVRRVARALRVQDRLRLAATFPRFARSRTEADRCLDRALVTVSSASGALLLRMQNSFSVTTKLGAFLVQHRDDPTVRELCERHGVVLPQLGACTRERESEIRRIMRCARDGALCVEDVQFWERHIDPSGEDSAPLMQKILGATKNELSQFTEMVLGSAYLLRILGRHFKNDALFYVLNGGVRFGAHALALHLLARHAEGGDTHGIDMAASIRDIIEGSGSHLLISADIRIFVYRHVPLSETHRTLLLDAVIKDMDIRQYAECRGLPILIPNVLETAAGGGVASFADNVHIQEPGRWPLRLLCLSGLVCFTCGCACMFCMLKL